LSFTRGLRVDFRTVKKVEGKAVEVEERWRGEEDDDEPIPRCRV
jgi:hypothetical protein